MDNSNLIYFKLNSQLPFYVFHKCIQTVDNVIYILSSLWTKVTKSVPEWCQYFIRQGIKMSLFGESNSI